MKVKKSLEEKGKQRYICRNQECPRCTFIRDYTHDAYKPGVKQKIPEMAINESGIRDTARVLSISTHTVMKELKKTIVVKLTPKDTAVAESLCA